jgi:aminopeptidase
MLKKTMTKKIPQGIQAMKLIDIQPVSESRLEQLKTFQTKPALPVWQDKLKTTIDDFANDFANLDDALQTLQDAQKILTVYKAGLENNTDFLNALNAAKIPAWKNYTAPPVSEELQHSLGDKIYNAERVKAPHAMIFLGQETRIIASHLMKRCMADGIPFDVHFSMPDFQAVALNHTNDAGVQAVAQDYIDRFTPINTKMTVVTDGGSIATDPPKAAAYRKATAGVNSRTLSGDMYYTLTVIPTQKDAQQDGMDYHDYIKLFFELCDQPWDHIKKQQEILIEKFDKANTVRITNDDGTDIEMSLVDADGRHFTFANSVIAKNVPGSEIFSAPRRDSVNGTIVAKGRFAAGRSGGDIIENLTMHFKDGRLHDFTADSGAAYFQEYLDRDPNNRYVGELGIGTNAHLGRHVVNGLLVEKIGGSFHLALGNSYSYTAYEGKPVHLKNGNVSATGDHWDITTMLRGHGGDIALDGVKVMENGRWLDPRLDVLNRGWAAVPVNERPDYWKNFTGYDGQGNAVWN